MPEGRFNPIGRVGGLRSAARAGTVAAVALLVCAGPAARPGGSQVVAPFIDGMTIHTSDSVSNVEVRAKSFGPGGCAVEFSTFSAKKGFVAPPLVYSPWTVLTASVGRNSFELHDDVKCDTGVVAQVRYFADATLRARVRRR